MPNPTDLPVIEHDVLDFWHDNNIFAKTVAARQGGKPFVFYDGPPFATGLPHYGHIMQMAFKDAVIRYKTMQGYNVSRRYGWDVHGLPVEYQLEKELGLTGGKRAIEEYGIDKFVAAARAIVLRYTKEWVATMERMGRWVDLSQPYTTMDNDYIESVWWAYKTLYDKGLVYRDFRVSPYCPRCGTVLSNFEVNQGYKDNVKDPSIYVALPLVDGTGSVQDAELVVWTTTPWTLPSNAAVAVAPEQTYAVVLRGERKFIVAKSRVSAVFGDDADVQATLPGRDLVGRGYNPLYMLSDDVHAYHVLDGGVEIAMDEGTGLVHIAPAYGEFDFQLGRANDLPLIQSVEPDGTVTKGKNLPGEGLFVKQADPIIINDLADHDRLIDWDKRFTHTYPFCWRCDTPLLYFPTTSWFIKVTAFKDRLIEENRQIHWMPEHLQQGRFGKWLEGARDWAVSRDRFWGAPIPVWECKKCHTFRVIGSRAEIKVDDDFDLHRPAIDAITVPCETCGGEMHRVPHVFDCWFESGSMPYAQEHYPFVRRPEFDPERSIGYPADYINEAIDQTRGWFYTLHVLGVGLFNERAYNNVVTTGLILDPHGRKLSKKLGNYNEPEELFETQGVDALRLFLFTATSLGEEYRFSDAAVADVKRRWLVPLLNVVTYLQLSQSECDATAATLPEHALLDAWIKARVFAASEQVATAMEGDKEHSPFDLVRAGRTFGPLIEDLSTWYVRLSRGRKDAAFTTTLREVLREISYIYAPFLPFVMEHLYQAVKGKSDPQSVHMAILTPKADWKNPGSLADTEQIRLIVSLGRELRAKAGIPVRQPLARLEIHLKDNQHAVSDDALTLIGQELQVEQVDTVAALSDNLLPATVGQVAVGLDTALTPDLEAKGFANSLRRTIQDLRKQANLKPGDKAKVWVSNLPSAVAAVLEPQLGQTQLISLQSDATVLGDATVREGNKEYTIQLY